MQLVVMTVASTAIEPRLNVMIQKETSGVSLLN